MPANLAATAGDNGTAVNLTWTDNSTTETGFKVYVSTDAANWSLLTTTAAKSDRLYPSGALSPHAGDPPCAPADRSNGLGAYSELG